MQPNPSPKNLCEGPAVGANPYPIDEDGVLRPTPFNAGDIANVQTAAHNGRTNEGQIVLTNGKNVGARAGGPLIEGYVPGALAPSASLLDVQPGQGLRLQFVNASNVRYFRLRLTTPGGGQIPLRRVGGEGGLLDNVVNEGGTQQGWVTKYNSGEILIPPGTRADVVAEIPPAPTSGVLTLWTRDFQRTGAGFSNVATVPVMHLNLAGPVVSPAYTLNPGDQLRAATGDPVEALPAPNGNFLNPAAFTPPKLGIPGQDIQLTQNGTTELGINNTFGTHDVAGDYMDAPHLGSTRYAEAGDTLGLQVTNTTGANHPFHLHGFSIQPISLDGPGATDFIWPYREFRDNVDVPNGYTLNYRVRLDPRTMPDGTTPGGAEGRWLFHCHIFFHATNGMLGELVVVNSQGNERPDVNVNTATTTVDQGTTATMNGTYKDPDGNPVTLSSSVGTVTDTGGGTWSWTYPTVGEQSKIVYITATDSAGLRGQIPFQLNVNDQPPSISKLKVKPKKIKASGKKRDARLELKKAKKAKITFNLSEPSKVKFKLKRTPKKKGAKKSFSKDLKAAGKQSVKLKTKGLPAGKYKLTAQATDPAGLVGGKVTTKFKIKKKKGRAGGALPRASFQPITVLRTRPRARSSSSPCSASSRSIPSFWAIRAGVLRAGFVSRLSRTSRAFSLMSLIRPRRVPDPALPCSPGVDEAPAPGGSLRARGGRERRGDHPPRVRRVDHVVELEERRRVERLGVVVRRGDHLLDPLLALGLVGDRLELAAEPEADGALQAHRAELGGRPADGEQRLVHAAAGHRLGAEPVGLAQDDGDERHPQVGAGDEAGASSGGRGRSPRPRARPSSPACRSARRSAGRRHRRAA